MLVRDRFYRHRQKFPNWQVFGNFDFQLFAKNSPNEKARPNFHKLARDPSIKKLGEKLAKLDKSIFPKTCQFGKFVAKYVS